MKLHTVFLSRLTALLLSLALALSFSCWAAEADAGEAPLSDTIPVSEAGERSEPEAEEPALEAEATAEYDGEESYDEGDDAQHQEDPTQTGTAGRDAAPYTLPVRSGMNISETLERAMELHSHIVIPEGSYTCDSIDFRAVEGVTIEAQGATIDGAYFNFRCNTERAVVKGGVWTNAYINAREAANFELRPDRLTVDTGTGAHGIAITSSQNLVLENVVVDGAGDDGIFISSSSDVTLINPQISRSYYFGIALRNGSTATIEGGSVTTSGQRPRSVVSREDAKAGGLSVTEGSVADVTDTVLSDNVACGVAVSGSSASERSTVNLYGVQLLNNGDHGVGGNPYATVNMDASATRRSLVKGNAHNGVQVIDSSTSDFIRGTDFTQNGQDGLSIAKGSTVKLVENCTMKGNTWHGVKVRQDSVVKKFSKCTFSGNKRYGILVNCESGTKTTSAALTGCTLKKNSADGIRIMGAKSAASIAKSTVTQNKGSGIVVQNKARLSSLTKTKVTKNSKYGIRVYGKCTVGSTKGSTFSGNKGKQISVDKGAKTKLKTKK